jgi:hypothetical protein
VQFLGTTRPVNEVEKRHGTWRSARSRGLRAS